MQQALQAANEQMQRASEESPYGKEPERGKATEVIARTVSSLPPENMFTLMKQMKHMVTTNPGQLRQYLTEHPQMAYALLQVGAGKPVLTVLGQNYLYQVSFEYLL